MKLTIFLLLSLCLAALDTGAQTAPKWVEYTSAEGKYSVLFPKKPTVTQQKAPDADGNMLDQFLVQAADRDALFLVAHFDYPATSTYDLDTGRDAAIANANGKLVSKNDVKLGTYPGSNFVYDAERGGFSFRVYGRFYDVGGRVLMLQYIVERAKDGPAQSGRLTRFFNSLKVLPKR